MKRTIKSLIVAVMALALTTQAFAFSSMVLPEANYDAHDFCEIEYPFQENPIINYTAGLEVVYANIPPNLHSTRCFLHVEGLGGDAYGADSIRLALYDYRGNYIVTICEFDPDPAFTNTVWPQCVKFDHAANEIWFSYTISYPGAANDWFYTVTWNPNDPASNYPVAPTPRLHLDQNWEVEFDLSGRPFFAGPDVLYGPYSIWIENGANLQEVVTINGYCCGFAFDNAGNLWSGSNNGENVQDFLYVWTAADVAAAVNSGGTNVLTTADAAQTISLPTQTIPAGTFYYGCSDVECDPEGNVYVSCNFCEDWNADDLRLHDHAQLLVAYSNGLPPWPAGFTKISDIWNQPAVWEWFRSLAYDGVSNLSDITNLPLTQVTDPLDSNQPTGNRLYLDMDMYRDANWYTGVINDLGPVYVTGISHNLDTDADGVPDALDNAFGTANGPYGGPYEWPGVYKHQQYDRDQDMFGDICDADFDDQDDIDNIDLNSLLNNWGPAPPESIYDLDRSGSVSNVDLNQLLKNYGKTAGDPWQ